SSDLLLIARVAVDQGAHRGAETLLVGTALEGVDRVREGVDGLLVAVVPLQRDLDLVVLALGLEADDRRVDRLLLAVDERDVVLQTLRVVVRLGARALLLLGLFLRLALLSGLRRLRLLGEVRELLLR